MAKGYYRLQTPATLRKADYNIWLLFDGDFVTTLGEIIETNQGSGIDPVLEIEADEARKLGIGDSSQIGMVTVVRVRKPKSNPRRRKNSGSAKGLKISQADFNRLKKAIDKVVKKHGGYGYIVSQYSQRNFPRADKVKDLSERLAFDLLHASNFKVRSLYDKGLNDDHIYSALKRIVPPVPVMDYLRKRKRKNSQYKVIVTNTLYDLLFNDYFDHPIAKRLVSRIRKEGHPEEIVILDLSSKEYDFVKALMGERFYMIDRSPKVLKHRSKRKNRGAMTVPSYIARTPRSKATNKYVFPRQKSYPIGDLYHARTALVFALSPTNKSRRAKVVQAVAKAYPQYNWSSWWNSRRKKGVPTWASLLKKKSKIRNPSHSFLDNNRLRGYSDYYSVGNRNVSYSDDPKTYRYIDLYEFLEEHFPSDIAKSKRTTYSNSTMNKLYERLIFYPDTHGMSANFVLLDRVKQNKDFDRFHSYLQDKILNGVGKYRKNPSHSTKAIENELKKLGFGSLVLSLRQEKPSSSDLKYYLKVVDGTRAELTKKEFSDKDYKRVKKLVTMWFKGV